MEAIGVVLALVLCAAPLFCLGMLFCLYLLLTYKRLLFVLKGAEHAYREREVLQKTSDLIPFFIVAVAKNRRIAFANAVAGKWAARPPQSLIGVPVALVIPCLKVVLGILKAQEISGGIRFQDKIPFPDGTIRDCFVQIEGTACSYEADPIASVMISESLGHAM